MEVQPSTLCGSAARLRKDLRAGGAEGQGIPKAPIFDWALSVGQQTQARNPRRQNSYVASWKLANKLVFSKIREGMGGKVETFISGGAPLGRELAEWYATVGIRIHEGYGLTETSPVIALNTPINHRIGTVGKIMPNLEVRIAEDGEILVRGPSIFKGYWNRPDETQSRVLADGWFKTGDIGNIDADGYLSVTDRKKDLIKTSGGKFIAPQPIENSLEAEPAGRNGRDPWRQAQVRRRLISPNFAALEDWAREEWHPVQLARRTGCQPESPERSTKESSKPSTRIWPASRS